MKHDMNVLSLCLSLSHEYHPVHFFDKNPSHMSLGHTIGIFYCYTQNGAIQFGENVEHLVLK